MKDWIKTLIDMISQAVSRASIFAVFVLSASGVGVVAQEVKSFDEIDQLLSLQFADTDEQLEQTFNKVELAVDRAYKGLTKRIERTWGNDSKLPSQSSWVTYAKDMHSRTIINYEQGAIELEVIVDENTGVEQALKRLKKEAKQTLSMDSASMANKDILVKEINKELTKEDLPVLEEPEDSMDFGAPVLENLAAVSSAEINALKIDDVQDVTEPSLVSPEPIPSAKKTLEPTIQKTSRSSEPDISVAAQEPKEMLEEKPLISDLQKPKQEPAPNVALKNEDNAASPAEAIKNNVELATTVSQKTNKVSGPEKVASELTVTEDTQATEFAANKPDEPVVQLKEENGVKKLSIKMAFVNNFQKILLENNIDDIRHMSEEYDVPMSIILAIIETESSFNPRATSPVPAFGLMQLVPRTAGIDAFNLVHGEKKVVSPEYLYEKRNNLELGTAYFHILTNRYLRGVSNATSRFYCAVASYNTGVGNLSRTFTGQKRIRKSLDAINKMTEDEVFDFLVENLPADETRRYLKKIVKRKKKYEVYDAT